MPAEKWSSRRDFMAVVNPGWLVIRAPPGDDARNTHAQSGAAGRGVWSNAGPKCPMPAGLPATRNLPRCTGGSRRRRFARCHIMVPVSPERPAWAVVNIAAAAPVGSAPATAGAGTSTGMASPGWSTWPPGPSSVPNSPSGVSRGSWRGCPRNATCPMRPARGAGGRMAPLLHEPHGGPRSQPGGNGLAAGTAGGPAGHRRVPGPR